MKPNKTKCCPSGTACSKCQPEIFHNPLKDIPDNRWWLDRATLEDKKRVVAQLNRLYREGSPEHPWYNERPEESDRRYDLLIKEIKELDPTYEEPL